MFLGQMHLFHTQIHTELMFYESTKFKINLQTFICPTKKEKHFSDFCLWAVFLCCLILLPWINIKVQTKDGKRKAIQSAHKFSVLILFYNYNADEVLSVSKTLPRTKLLCFMCFIIWIYVFNSIKRYKHYICLAVRVLCWCSLLHCI